MNFSFFFLPNSIKNKICRYFRYCYIILAKCHCMCSVLCTHTLLSKRIYVYTHNILHTVWRFWKERSLIAVALCMYLLFSGVWRSIRLCMQKLLFLTLNHISIFKNNIKYKYIVQTISYINACYFWKKKNHQIGSAKNALNIFK